MKALRRFFAGIRFRLMSWFIGVLALVLLLFSAFVYTRQAQDLRDTNLSRLAIKARQLESLFQLEGLQSMQDVRQLMPLLISGGVALVQEDEVLVVADPNTQWTAQLGPIGEADIQRLVTEAEQGRQSAQPHTDEFKLTNPTTQQNQGYIFLIIPIEARGRPVGYMLLGRPSDATGQLPRLAATLALASLAVLLGAAGGGYWLAGRVLRPVQAITRTARQISDSDLSRRLNLNSPDELGELSNTFDEMLARLEAGFERQRQFTADASHELRTPLTIIGLETGRMLGGRRTPEEYQQVLRTIQNENDHMTRLVNDLLQLARMESGQTRLDRTSEDLSDLVVEVLERLMPLAANQRVHLEAGDLPETLVQGDRAMLAQMVSNLVSNAIKYARSGDGWVKVETGTTGGQAWVRVEDNGAGVAPEDRPYIFDRFYRADRTGSQERDPNAPTGSGLGLAIVRWIAQAHGGEACLEESSGTGAVFRVTLPSGAR